MVREVHPSKFLFWRGLKVHDRKHRKSQKIRQTSVKTIRKVHPSMFIFQKSKSADGKHGKSQKNQTDFCQNIGKSASFRFSFQRGTEMQAGKHGKSQKNHINFSQNEKCASIQVSLPEMSKSARQETWKLKKISKELESKQ